MPCVLRFPYPSGGRTDVNIIDIIQYHLNIGDPATHTRGTDITWLHAMKDTHIDLLGVERSEQKKENGKNIALHRLRFF
jgi:hypothetical protein